MLIGTALAVAAAAVMLLLGEPLGFGIASGAVLGLVLVALAARAAVAGAWQRSAAAFLATAIVVYGTLYGLVFPGARALWLSPAMAEAVAVYAPCPNPIVATVGYHEPSAVFLIGADLHLASAARAAELADLEDCVLVFVDERNEVRFLAEVERPLRVLHRIDGWRLNGGRWTTLTLYGN